MHIYAKEQILIDFDRLLRACVHGGSKKRKGKLSVHRKKYTDGGTVSLNAFSISIIIIILLQQTPHKGDYADFDDTPVLSTLHIRQDFPALHISTLHVILYYYPSVCKYLYPFPP